MAEAPEIFHVDEKGKLTVLDGNPNVMLLQKAQSAEKYCPAGAIRIVKA